MQLTCLRFTFMCFFCFPFFISLFFSHWFFFFGHPNYLRMKLYVCFCLKIFLSQQLSILSKCVSTFCTSHELCHSFIPASSLNHPNINFVIFTFVAFLFDFCHSVNFIVLTYHCHKRLRCWFDNSTCSSFNFPVYGLLCKVTFRTAKHKGVAVAGFFGFKA